MCRTGCLSILVLEEGVEGPKAGAQVRAPLTLCQLRLRIKHETISVRNSVPSVQMTDGTQNIISKDLIHSSI